MEHSISSDFIRGHIDTIILHTITDGDKFAQQISDTIEEKSQNKYQINQATLYSSLKRLESLGYVKSYWNDAPDGRRKFIKITDTGKAFLEENMSVWAYSRGIIDKLMDAQPEQVVKYVEIEKPIQSPVAIDIDKTNIESDIKSTSNQFQQNIEKPVEKLDTNINDISFRSILAELIKTNDVIEINSDEKNDTQEIISEKQEKLKLEDTIDDVDYIPNNNVGFSQIDFTDIIETCKKDDLKVKISTKNASIKVGSVYVNLVNFVSSIMIFVICLAEFLYVSSRYSEILGLNPLISVIAICAFSIFPIIKLINYTQKPKKTAPKIFGDTILVSFIVAFNIILITFALNLLLNVDFNETSTIILSLALPVILTLNSIIYFVVRFLFSKIKCFRYKV